MILPHWRLKGAIFRFLCPIFFRKVGRGTILTGRVRLPYPFMNIVLGQSCMIGNDVFLQVGRDGQIKMGNNVSINTGAHIVAREKIYIGENVAIGEFVTIRDQSHIFDPDSGVRGNGFHVKPVVIEDNVWIGRGVYIGPGAIIRRGSIVGANAVVNGEFPPNVLIAGVPARIKRSVAKN